MIKVPTAKQIREADQYTILHEPIASIDLMERAAKACYRWFSNRFDRSVKVVLLCGPGNNGGDGLALARMLKGEGYKVRVILADQPDKLSADCLANYKRYIAISGDIEYLHTLKEEKMPASPEIVVDALFGTGLGRPLEGQIADLVNRINESGCTIVSIDLPTGMVPDGNSIASDSVIIHAGHTLSFEVPKLAMFLPEHEKHFGQWYILPIGLHPEAIARAETSWYLTEVDTITGNLTPRNVFSHKGTYGHGLLIAGTEGMAGAAILGARAALRSGIGLLTVHSARCNREILQTAVAEAIFSSDKSDARFTSLPERLSTCSAMAIGPGLGTHTQSQDALQQALQVCQSPIVLDADALNLLALYACWPGMVPRNTILTPHPGEFDRLCGASVNHRQRLDKAREKAFAHQLIIVLKGHYTAVALPDGTVWFNPTGNAGMATAGCGDVLTGIILSLLAQGMAPADAALTGVYLHGLAGDIAARQVGKVSLTASDIIDYLPNAWNKLIPTNNQ